MIQLNSISKIYPGSENYALKDISFSAEKGEIVGLLGENGAGKSTLLLIMSTLLKPSSGSATIMEMDIQKEPEKIRRMIGVFLNNQRLYERLTGRENIQYYARLHGEEKCILKDKVDHLSEIFNMSEYIDNKVSTYSQGMKQKVSVARMLVHDPSILLLDEPVTGLDLSSVRIFYDFMLKCREQNKVVIFSSHNLNDMKEISDRVIILHKGQIAEQGKIEELSGKYKYDLEKLYISIIQDQPL